MNKADLQTSLEALQTELENLDTADSETKAHIQQIIDALKHQLDNPDDESNKQSLTERLTAAVEQFEVEHPKITDTLNRIMVMLGSMGI